MLPTPKAMLPTQKAMLPTVAHRCPPYMPLPTHFQPAEFLEKLKFFLIFFSIEKNIFIEKSRLDVKNAHFRGFLAKIGYLRPILASTTHL